jgi:ATP-dependent helicase HrpB
MQPLPIDDHLSLIIERLRESRAIVIVAEPGAGKTTRVPPAILRSNLLGNENSKIVMLQPRRVAARAAAIRIAQENNWKIGEEVGWHVRFDKHIGPQTRLRVLTEGILARQLIDDPFLPGIGAVVLDEFHERSIHTDLTIAMLREVRENVRDDLLLIVMSATLDAEPIAKFLGGCPIVNVPGRLFPIEIDHANAPSSDAIHLRAAKKVRELISLQQDGDMLVFLPGVAEINRTETEISSFAQQHDLQIAPLHGNLSLDAQNLALAPSDRRKIILATNIAETSLTIDGVRIVIDSGLARVAGYDPQRGLDRLDLKRISKASATQRAGRAGRTAPGKCMRLYTSKEFHALADFELPEIRRVDLSSTVLSLHAWGKSDPRTFGWFDPPSEQALATAERLLEMLGAIENGRITSLGRQMVLLPVHPRLARLLIAAAEENLLEEGATMAALLSEKDIAPFDRSKVPKTKADSDLLMRFDLVDGSLGTSRTRDQLIRIGKSIKPSKIRRHDQHEAMLRLALIAYPDRVCRRRENDLSAGVMVGGGGVRLADESVVRNHEFFVALDARQNDRNANREAIVNIASAIEPQWLEKMFPREIKREKQLIFDLSRQRVVALASMKYRDLVIREDHDAPVDAENAGKVLAEALSRQAAEIINADEAAKNWLARLDLLRRAMPEHVWPEIDLNEILAEMCRGKKSAAELRSALPFLQAQLQYPLDRIFEENAPETIAAATGNRIRLQYAIGQAPVMAVRLQEMFGIVETPRVAIGRVAVVMHLLGPNYRPVQITDDLKSFWKATYFQVRKDLRVRYPKHSWPQDPLSAMPQAKGGRRR